ncbi:MAG: AI-2E family transporter [Ruminococcaceae bacterium]|nr:AI-2E family transporter [Oscillospiraceae bacterium]
MKDKKSENEKIQFSIPLNKRLLKYVFFITLIIAIAYTVVTQPQKIISILGTIVGLVSPFIIGFCAAYVVNLVLRPLERFWMWIWKKTKNQKVVLSTKRPICLTFSFLIVIGAIFAIVFMVIPAFKETVVSFANKVPQYAKTIEGWYYTAVEFFEKYNFTLPEISLNTAKLTQFAKDIISNYGSNVLDTTVNVTASIVSAVVDMVLGLVFAVYLLAQKEKLGSQVKKVMSAVLMPKRAQGLTNITALTNDIFTKFITGQFADACIIGVLCFIGMLIFRMPYAAIISVLIGFTALVPIFGAFIGAGVGAFLILLESPIKAFWFIVFIIILQQIEGNLIYPKVVGKSVGLPGIWVLVAVTVGGSLFGVLGMLFGVPVCTVMYVLLKDFVNSKSKNNEQSNAVEGAEDDQS